MQSMRRSAVSASRTASRQIRGQPRRYAHDAHGGAHHAEPVNESYGPAFFIAVGSIPVSYAVYKFANSGEGSVISKIIEKYSDYQEDWAKRNELHTRYIEQAASDSNLFKGSASGTYVDLRMPEAMGAHSPIAVPAGQGSINLNKVLAHYEKKNFEENERKLQAFKDGTLEAEQDRSTRPVAKRLWN